MPVSELREFWFFIPEAEMKMDLTAMIEALETREQEAAVRALHIYNKEV